MTFAKKLTVALLCLTWALPQTIVGAIVFLVTSLRCKHAFYQGAIVSEWRFTRGLSLSAFIFVPKDCSRALVVHEFGHTLQSLALGPLYLPVIVLPSLIWAGTPALERRRQRRRTSYYAFYTERWANAWAERVCHERTPR